MSSHHTFLLAEKISFGFFGIKHEHSASVFGVSTFEASPSESEFSLPEECASTSGSGIDTHERKPRDRSSLPPKRSDHAAVKRDTTALHQAPAVQGQVVI